MNVRPESCPTPSPYSGASCKRRGCPFCGHAWALSYQSVMRCNFAHYGGAVVLISITAPGRSVLPWSCGLNHVHEGAKGCRVKDDYADLWAADCTERLRKLRDAARLAVKRAGLPVDTLWLGRVWEPQKRQVPHAHVVAGASTPIEYAAAMRFHAELERLAPDYGFGTQVHVTKRMEPREAARYLAGYLMGRTGKKGSVRDNLADPRMPRLLVYVARSLTRETGVIMRRLRYARWYFAVLAERVFAYPRLYGEELLALARVIAQLERATGPPEVRIAGHVRNLRAMRSVGVDRERREIELFWQAARAAA